LVRQDRATINSGDPPSCGANFCSDRWLHRPRWVGWPVRYLDQYPTLPNASSVDCVVYCVCVCVCVTSWHESASSTARNRQLKCKTEKKLKSKKRICCKEITVNSLGNPRSQSWIRKRRLRWEGFAEKEKETRKRPHCIHEILYIAPGTHTRLTTLFPGLPGKVKPIWIHRSKRQWVAVAVASAEPYASLHLAPDR